MRALLMILFLFLCKGIFAQIQFGKNDYSRPLYFLGNKITFAKPIELKVQGLQIESIPCPKELNGEKIFSYFLSVDKPPKYIGNATFDLFMLNSVKEVLALLPNGRYNLSLTNIIIDKHGQIAYFDFHKLIRVSKNVKQSSVMMTAGDSDEDLLVSLEDLMKKISTDAEKNKTGTIKRDLPYEYKQTEEKIYSEIYKILSLRSLKFKPAYKNNKPVNCFLEIHPFFFEVNNGQIKFEESMLTTSSSAFPPSHSSSR